MRILFTGGGTGGHFYPIIAVIREIKKIVEEERLLSANLYYVGPDDFGEELLKKEKVRFIRIMSGKWRRYASVLNLLDILKIIGGTIKAFFVLFSVMPDVVFSKGGYGSIPALVVSILYGVPLIVHESDSVPGIINRVSARFADRVAISFQTAEKYLPKKARIALTGNPIRLNLLGGSREAAEEGFSVFSKRLVILILGGSQGSRPINQTVLETIRELVRDFEIIHQTGKNNYTDVSGEASVILTKAEYAYYHPVGYFDDSMTRSAYALADIIVSRAGAASIFEIAASGKPSILIPLKNSAQEHQKQNAYEYAGYGAANVIEEDNLTPSVFLNEILKLVGDSTRRAEMTEHARHFAKTDAAIVIAREILELGAHKG